MSTQLLYSYCKQIPAMIMIMMFTSVIAAMITKHELLLRISACAYCRIQ